MERPRGKETAGNQEKPKKKNDQEKKTKSETITQSSSSITEPSLDNMLVVGRSYGYAKSKSFESGYRLHQCYSEAAINPVSESSQNFRDVIHYEGLHPVASNSSFLSARSDLNDVFHKQISDLEDRLFKQNLLINSLKNQLCQKPLPVCNSVATETDISIAKEEKSKLKDLEKKICNREKKIRELNQKLEETSKTSIAQKEENNNLSNRISLLNRQLQSMFEFLGNQKWTSIDPIEFAKYKNKTTELEASLTAMEEEKCNLSNRIKVLTTSVENKEKEYSAKARELVEYKNRSTLEMCKLINQIDCLQMEAKRQSDFLETKISEAQNAMEEEIVTVTQKLEEQYQKDMKSAIDKFHSDFERLADLPKAAIERLLQFCEPDKVDFINYQKEWNKHQAALEEKIVSMQADHKNEIRQLKDNYDAKIMFLKTQVEAMTAQLKERKNIIDIFENELMIYKSNSSMNLLKASTLSDDISALKELYTSEIFSQKQVHKLQLDIFEEKVKTLTEEILFHAKNEEIHLQELENARKMASIFREKYELLVFEWEEKVEKDFKNIPTEAELTPELDTMIAEFKGLIESLKKSEEVHEERIKMLETKSNDERVSFLQDIEEFKTKLQDLMKFQKTQAKLDETIHNLIRTVGLNYTKTVEALLMSHMSEISLKQVEMCASQKRHIEEIDGLKNDHEKEVEELRSRVEHMEGAKIMAESELASLRKLKGSEDLEALKEKTAVISLEFMKAEGMMAIKEETERALDHRIKELENIIKLKEENCKKELEDLTAKYLKAEIMSSSKDDLTKELEEKLTNSETLLEKSWKEIDRLTEIASQLKVNHTAESYHRDEGDFNGSSGFAEKFQEGKMIGERLKVKLAETFERIEKSEELARMKENAAGEEKRNKISNENDQLKEEVVYLLEEVRKKEEILAEMKMQNEELQRMSELKKKLEMLETEKDEILRREKLAEKEKEEILERNEFLQESIQDLNSRIDMLMAELANNKDSEGTEVFSISLQEVRFLYEEEREVETSMSTASCQAQLPENTLQNDLLETNQMLQKENETLRLELRERQKKAKAELFHEKVMSKFRNIQKELSDVAQERDELIKERNSLNEEVEELREENLVIQAKYETKLKVLEEKNIYSDHPGMSGMNEEISKLTDYIKALSKKLDLMKTSNEVLLSESREHLKHNQNLVNELEEAWSQRYEIEDQLAKVRRENALLNLHRQQLEETNKRISGLVAEGKPSVVSWIKIHETVENIVDEVLALKTSFSDSESVLGGSSVVDPPRTNCDLKLMTETLHTQLRDKMMLCDELIIQKETLEKELKNLETLMLNNQSRLKRQRALENSSTAEENLGEIQNAQPAPCSLEWTTDWEGKGLDLGETGKTSDSSRLIKLNKLKKHLEDQAKLEKAQFRENLELEIQELKKEIQKLQDSQIEEIVPSENDDECLKTIEMKYEKKIEELSKEFEREVEKLREMFGTEKEGGENCGEEIDRLKKYFLKKWTDLENEYMNTIQKQKRQSFDSNSETSRILEHFHSVFSEEDQESERKSKIENFLREVLNRRDEEVKSLREKYKEAVTMLESKHDSEVEKLQAVVLQLKENIMTALKKESERRGGEEEDENQEDLIERIRAEYEAKLEEEKKKICDLLEDAKQKHDKEMGALEEFWTEKLSECETKCAIMKATGGRNTKSQGETEDEFKPKETEHVSQTLSEEAAAEEKQIVKYGGEIQEFDSVGELGIGHPRENLCVSCLANRSFFKRMELKTDDDKLDVIQQRDTLEEMISSTRNIITKLLTFIAQQKPELNNTSLDIDDTMYKSIHVDFDRTVSDVSTISNGALLAKDLSTIFQEIKENSLLNSSDQVRFELDKCLKQLRNDATYLLALSWPENPGPNLSELIKKVEREKNELEEKVLRVEEIQAEMKKEINTTKERLSQWERNLEVVSEGYGEEIIEPKKRISLSDMKEKLKAFLAENCGHSPQDINLLEEICKEGDRLQEEWMKEKCDLQQQIDVADKQLHSLKKFLEEQAVEREQEREAFDREIMQLRENLKAKERDNSLQNRTNREVGRLSVMSLADISVETLVGQVKDLTARLTEAEKNKGTIEGEFQNAVKKIWSLREVIQDLESQLAEVSERESNLKKKVDKLDGIIEQQSKAQRSLKEELEVTRTQNELKYSEHIKSLEDELIRLRHVADQVSPESLTQLKANIRQIEAALIKKTKDLEQLHVSSANVSCSSPSEDVSIRDHLDATRCSTPDEMCTNGEPLSLMLPMEEIDRVHEKLARHTRAEEVAMKYIQDLKMQLRTHRKAFEEVQTERDVLLEKVDVYLKENSSLKVRLEEQRCNAGLLQKQLNANLESQISRLEVDVEKLNGMCNEKDKQLRDMKVILENTKKSLKLRETEVLNKSKEENALITSLKTDLANALNENEQLEEKLEKTREKLRETMKMPALIDSMIEEKNAEIDRLEKEVERLSSEKTTSGVTSRSYSSEEKLKRRIRFSEPDSFSENISSISVQCPSDLRNCSDSYADFKNSSFKTRRPVGSSTKLESISSIAPLQLSPRGADSSFNWKPNMSIVQNEKVNISPSRSPLPTKPDLQQMEEMSKLHKEIEKKQSEISELQLEIDILKRQLVEVSQEVATAKSQLKETRSNLAAKEEEIRKIKNNEKSLLITIDSLKKSHEEEVEELQNKLKFEHGKVEMVYEEIKALEVKKIEIEEAFLSLKEDYNEKIDGEKKTAEVLLHRIRMLENRNGETELKMAALGKQLEDTIAESENTIQTLSKEISDLKSENEKIHLSSRKVNAETQVEGGACVCQGSLSLQVPETEGSVAPFKENLDELKAEFDKMAAVIGEKDFNKKEAFLYAMTVRRLLSVVLRKVEELSKEVESHMKKVMECSVDDLAVKVQKELVLSAKLDNQLLSSIQANGFVPKEATPQPDSLDAENYLGDLLGGGDGKLIVPQPLGNAALSKVAGLYKDVTTKMVELVRERENLEEKVSEQQRIIRLLEDSLKKEKERILEEKERCTEDAKIMELLRVNLEKRLHDVRTKEKELKREKQQRMALEKEIETFKKQGVKCWESKKVAELNAQLESHREKLLSMSKLLEEEKKKSQELRLALEEEKIERISEKNAQRFLDSDLALIREQKENLKMELLNARKLLHSRSVEIGLLKRKINLQEIDIKALSLSNNVHNPSDTSSLTSSCGNLTDLGFAPESPTCLLFKMRKLNSCVQRHVKESSDMGEALFYLSQEAEQMKNIIRKLEENSETKVADETLVPDVEVERKLWALEKGKLVMDLEAVKRENEILKTDLIGFSKMNEALKQENSKLKKDYRSPKKDDVTDGVENGFLQERVSHLTRKYMRTESYRKALAWQKQYLLVTLQEYQRSEEEAWRKMGKRKKEIKKKVQKCGRFRVVAIAVVATFRMKFIVKKWQRTALNHVFSLLETQTHKLKLAPLASVLNIYNEPVNPLSYQTQNIFHQSSSQVLRTPPSRDPGPQSFSLVSKAVPDRLEPFDFCKENRVDILKGLP